MCDQMFTLGCTSTGFTGLKATNNLLLESGDGCTTCICAGKVSYIDVCRDTWSGDPNTDISTNIRAFDEGCEVASIFVGTDVGEPMTYIYSMHYNILSAYENCLCSQCCNVMQSKINCICARAYTCNVINVIEALSYDGHTGENCIYASTINCLRSLCNNGIQSGIHCWVFCCDGNLYKDGVCVL